MKLLRKFVRYVRGQENYKTKTGDKMNLKEYYETKYTRVNRPIPNHRQRHQPVDGIIIHSMGQLIKGYGAAADFLDEIGLSAHYLIEIDGTVINCVEPTEQAYHAGASEFAGQSGLNSTFIGIEVLVEGEHDYLSFLKAIKANAWWDDQYDSLAILSALLCRRFGIPLDRIVRHSTVSGPEVRDDPKQDPGEGFQWERYKILTRNYLNRLEEDSNASDDMA